MNHEEQRLKEAHDEKIPWRKWGPYLSVRQWGHGGGIMKALAVFPSSREVRLIDQPEPMIGGPTEVKLRILEAGICGTDREIASFQYGMPPVNSPHLVIGHEALGEVVDVGSDVTEIGRASCRERVSY